ncbi:MAG: arylsulfatase [Bacteroidota bacterium]
MSYKVTIFLILCLLVSSPGYSIKRSNRPPNVILVMTDDQGIGDLGCHGNPWIKTPNLDSFYQESVRLTNFHVSPLCTPTRAAIVTGQYPIHNGAWATFKGRASLHHSSPTIAEVFQQNGYTTGMFGKWHLGDNYPARPTDCGFDHAVHHSSGGVGEISDYWGNSYFNDVYLVNNEPTQFEGYCTDVWFEEANQFILQHQKEPFFIYLPTNAPHAPLIVAEKYSQPYEHLEGSQIPSAEYYGMITNIDENFGRLDSLLKATGLAENTILIFCSDNGTQFGFYEKEQLGYNQGYRGNKGDKLEGGHRVPFFIRWPQAGIQGGRDIDNLLTHVDLFPTLASWCQIKLPDDLPLDGLDFSGLFSDTSGSLPARTVFVHHRQDWRPPLNIDQTCLMKEDWRLIDGQALYNVQQDRAQENNLAEQHPEVVESLLKENKEFIAEARQREEYQALPYAIIGSDQQQLTTFTIQHAVGDDGPLWKPEQIAWGVKNKNNTHAIAIAQPGKYRISCRRWPEEYPGSITGKPLKHPKHEFEYESISPEKVRIELFDQEYEKTILPAAEEVAFELELPKGKTLLRADFVENGERYGVYYIYAEMMNK